MNNDWDELLHASDAVQQSTTDSMVALGSYVSTTTPQLCDLSSYRVYEIGGSDATAFLQGQFCNDIAAVSSTQAQITGYCTPKGRLLALPTIVGIEGGGYRMLVPESVAEAFIKRLSMFVMRSDVSITVLEDWVGVGVIADAAGDLGELAPILGALPVGLLSASSDQAENNPGQTIRWHDDFSGSTGHDRASGMDTGSSQDGRIYPSQRARYLRLAPIARQKQLWTAINENERKHSDAVWRLADISAGVPSVTRGIVEAFVPQMVNLQLIKGLSFTKGCYPGQEIVARMQYLGKLKRHMRVFRVALEGMDVNGVLVPGATLSLDSDENAGIVVDAMPCSSDTALVLAVTKVTPAPGTFALTGAPLEPQGMPYELPSLEVA